MKFLNIDSTIRENSRTKVLTDYLLQKLGGKYDENVETLRLEDADISPLNSATLKLRDELIAKQDFSHPMFNYAKQFAEADIIVISAPLWDLSFPASLKTYFENINVLGLVFDYSKEGFPISLCKAKQLFYVTTSGGPIQSDDYGFGYIKALSETFYGINDIKYIKAEGLDIYGADVEHILDDAKREIDGLFE